MSPDLQSRVERLLAQLVADGIERGIQVAAYWRGKLVVEAWAGTTSGAGGDRVSGETLFPVFSTTKGIAATILHLLVQRGEISYDTPVADLWPEFGAQGKRVITLRHALSHSAGIPQMPAVPGYRELCDWNWMCAAIAELEPLSPPGLRTEYHAMTFGWIVGELARRIDGRDFGKLVRDEICRPLGIDSMFVGLPDDQIGNVATLEEKSPDIPSPEDTKPAAVPSFLFPLHAAMNRADLRRACIPATNGIMNARAIAAHYAALLPSGLGGVRLLSDESVRAAATPQSPEWGLGYQLGGGASSFYPEVPRVSRPVKVESNRGRVERDVVVCDILLHGSGDPCYSAFGHGGYGGSLGVADPELDLAIGITKNRFNGDSSVRSIVAEIRRTMSSAREEC